MEQLTIIDYIKKVQPVNQRDKTVLKRQGVLWRINNNIDLPQVKKIEKIGKQYVLTIH